MDWSANNQSGTFQFIVVSQSGVNTIPYLQVPMVNGLMIFGGSCIGTTLATGAKILTTAQGGAFNLVQMHFGETQAGSSGTVAGMQNANAAPTPIQGSYKLTRISS